MIRRHRRAWASMRIVAPLLAIVTAWILLIYRVGPVPTWFYVFAWYPTLVLLDQIAACLGQRSLFGDRRLAISMFLWSSIIWLVFEAANFRLSNWYYVQLPHALWERWLGIVLSFATVVPAIVLAERVLAGAGAFRNWKTAPLQVRPWELPAAMALGVVIGGLALLDSHTFFPLIWGAAFLIADPLVYRRAPALSLLGDLSRGEWGRILRLLVGGLAIGFLWESYNFWAEGKWIYTVPWLEETKLFEMPPFGLLGFPVFALEAWSMYAVLTTFRIAIPVKGAGVIDRQRVALTGLAATLFAVVTLLGMERYTISSTVPRLPEMQGVSPALATDLHRGGIDSPDELARATPEQVADAAGLDSTQARGLIDAARLVTLRGIGTAHGQALSRIGVRDVCALARSDDADLVGAMRETNRGARPTRPEVRVWIRGARRACPDSLAFE